MSSKQVSCQMFVKSEFPINSALACDSDKKWGGICFATSKVIKSKMAAVDFMKCTLCHFYTFEYMRNLFFSFIDLKNEKNPRWEPYKCKTAQLGSPSV